MYGPVRTVVWQGSAGNRRPYADQQQLEPTALGHERVAAQLQALCGPEVRRDDIRRNVGGSPSYDVYRANVRRWWPRIKPWRGSSGD